MASLGSADKWQRARATACAIRTGECIPSGFVTLSSGEERSADGGTASNCECELTRMHRRAGKGISLRCWEGQTNAGWNRDSGLEIKHDPCWGMVARVFLPTLNPALDSGRQKT
jgi:hypothetical protein